MKTFKWTVILTLILLISFNVGFGQEIKAETETKKESKFFFDPGVDVMSQWIWRGIPMHAGPSLQPYFIVGYDTWIEVGAIGIYGPVDFYTEMDLYAAIHIGDVLTLGVTDYYVQNFGTRNSQLALNADPASDWLDFSSTTAHMLEANLGIKVPKTGLALRGDYSFYGNPNQSAFDTVGDASKHLNSIYAEAKYSFKKGFDVFLGAGNGGALYNAYWGSFKRNEIVNNSFALVSAGVTYNKDIVFSPKFKLPTYMTLVTNPNSRQVYFVIGCKL